MLNKRLRLKRISSNPDLTAGVLINEGTGLPICFTLEESNNFNLTDISCIPEGSYTCQPYSSEKYPDVYVVTNVPNREDILFHVGNTTKDTRGCILPGMFFGSLKGKPAVRSSSKAMNLIKHLIGSNRFVLTIEGV